jgi:hypothetical protein
MVADYHVRGGRIQGRAKKRAAAAGLSSGRRSRTSFGNLKSEI